MAIKNEPKFLGCNIKLVGNNRYALVFSVELSGDDISDALRTAMSVQVWDRPKKVKRARRKR